MIRINLLATERRAAKAAAAGFQAGQKMMVIGSLMLVLTAGGVGWRYWALGQQKAAGRARHRGGAARRSAPPGNPQAGRGVREPPQACSKRASR